MSIDLKNVQDLRAFRKVLEQQEEGTFVVKQKGAYLFQRVWNRVSFSEERAGAQRVKEFLKMVVQERVQDWDKEHEALAEKVVKHHLQNYLPYSGAPITKKVAHSVFNDITDEKNFVAWGTAPRVYERMGLEPPTHPRRQSGSIFEILKEYVQKLLAFSQPQMIDLEEQRKRLEPHVRNLMRWLFDNPEIFGRGIYSIPPELISVGVFRRNTEFLKLALEELQIIALGMCVKLEESPLSEGDRGVTEVFLRQLVGLFPFFEPQEGTTLRLPQKIGSTWQVVDFKVEHIKLTPPRLGPPILAFGLIPQGAKEARVQLLFPGTSQPTASWAPLDACADFIPGYGVGEMVFNKWGKEVLQKWLESRSRGGKKVDVSGVSLGGSLSLLTVSHLAQYIGSVYAFVPPGQRKEVVERFDRYVQEHPTTAPNVHLYWQDGDIISLTGATWSKHWKGHALLPLVSLGPFQAHNKFFSAQPLTAVIQIDAEKDSNRLIRKVIHVAHQVISLALFPLTATYVLFRVVYYAMKGWGGKKARTHPA